MATKSSKAHENVEWYWYMSEKHNGIRGYWDSESKKMYTRQGIELASFPKHWKKLMPTFPVEGELWFGYSEPSPQRTYYRLQIHPESWTKVQFMIFDAVIPDLSFAERYEILTRTEWPNTTNFQVIKQFQVSDWDHVNDKTDQVLDRGGEGLILRNPRAPYTPGRTIHVVKWKPKYQNYAMYLGGGNFATHEAVEFRMNVTGTLDIGTVYRFQSQGTTVHGKPLYPVLLMA